MAVLPLRRRAARSYPVSELHKLLLAAARFEVGRRRAALSHLRGSDHDDLAQQSADDALMAILDKLDEFRGESRFTTWAYKFALLEAATKVRRRAWQGREIPLEEEAWSVLADVSGAAEQRAEDAELFAALREEIQGSLSNHQRTVLVAVALNDVRSTSSPSASVPPVALSTRRSTTPAASCAPRSPSADSNPEMIERRIYERRRENQ
jgi:RNA polymerase sigma-70 factor, ECF subfamily